jgi:hypothetical protein
VSALAEVLREAADADVTVAVVAGDVKVRAPHKPAPELVVRLRTAKPEILHLHRQHGERLATYAARYPAETAERMAFNVATTAWHTAHGHKPPITHCAGCHAPLANQNGTIRLHDGAHLHDSNECLKAWGEKWRTGAADALARIGISRPATWEP